MTMCYVVKSYNKKTSADTLKSTETSQSNVTTSGQSVEGSVTLKMGAKATSRISFFAALLANCSQLAQSVHEEVPRIETQAVFFFNSSNYLHGQQRMAAEVKEVVMDANLFNFE